MSKVIVMTSRLQPTTDFASDDRLAFYGEMLEAQRRLQKAFGDSIRNETGMSIVWFEALLRLARSPANRLPINELGRQMQISSGGATRMVDRLEQEGYIERAACDADRRVLWCQLTDAGVEVLERAVQVHLQDLDELLLAHIADDERASMRASFAAIKAGIESPG